MNKLLKDAIADAKAVRETALANAKQALEEAFAPKLQSMLSHKIKEEMDELGGEEESSEDELGARMRKNAGIGAEDGGEGESMEMDASFSDEGGEGEVQMTEPEAPETNDEWADDEMSGEEDYSEEPSDDYSDDDLEEILRELESEDDMEMSYSDEEEDLMEMEDASDEEEDLMEMEDASDEDDEEIDIQEVIDALREGKTKKSSGGKHKSDKSARPKPAPKSKRHMAEDVRLEKDLKEAYDVINFLRGKLNEVNLLNAKLLFVNKLFRKGTLSESQKVRVIETLDRAATVREAKLIYATLSESINKTANAKPKKSLNEGRSASAPIKGTSPAAADVNPIAKRFNELINYNKNN